jgi:hypothetical protein
MLRPGVLRMAEVLTFSAYRSHRVIEPGRAVARPEGKLIAMRHVDLQSVLETVKVLRRTEWAAKLDPFNSGESSEAAGAGMPGDGDQPTRPQRNAG